MTYLRRVTINCCDCLMDFSCMITFLCLAPGRCPKCKSILDNLTPEQKEQQRQEALKKVTLEFLAFDKERSC